MGMEQQEEQDIEQQQPAEGDAELEAQRVATFAAEFEGKPTEPPPADPEEQQQEEQQAAAAAPAEQPAPKYAQITEEQLAELTARAAKVADLEQALKRDRDAIYGTIGGLQRSINSRQAISLPKDKLDALRNDLPEVAELLDAMAQATTAPTVDQEAIVKSAEERFKPQLEAARQEALTLARQELRAELLSQVHPTWQADTETPEFQTFVKAQGQEFMGKLAKASAEWDHRVIGDALTQWKAAKKRADTSANTRRDRMAANVTPRGSSSPANPSMTREEVFLDEFNKP